MAQRWGKSAHRDQTQAKQNMTISSSDTWQLFDEPEDTLGLVHERDLDKLPERLDARRTTLDGVKFCGLHMTWTS